MRWVLTTLLLPAIFGLAQGADLPKKPNVVFILTDDQGYGDLSAHGNPILKTPNLDRLHAEGVRFTNFHVSPTCSPTRAALLTGRHEFKNGVTHTILERERLTLNATTIAEVLKSAGYATGIFGKWHLGDEPNRWPSQRGFDEMFIHGCGGIGQTYPLSSGGDAPGNTYFDPIILHNGRFVKTKGYCTDVFFDQAINWMGSVKGKQPFFCYVATNAPHAPLQVRPEDEARYKDLVKEANVAKFYGMIANIDDNVGKLLAKLQAWGLEKDTLVVFMNDNGGTVGVPVYNAGMRGAKATAWTGGTRAASLWRWPGTFLPGDCDRLTAHLDFFPTLAELAGANLSAEVQKQVEGRSLVPLLREPKAPWDDRTLFTHVGRWPRGAKVDDHKYAKCGVRTSRWRLVSEGGAQPGWQLFDLTSDPSEKTDVATQHRDVLTRLNAEYDIWWASLPPYLVNENAVAPRESTFAHLHRRQLGELNALQRKPATLVAIEGAKFLINGQVTYQGRTWNGQSIEGLLFNSRMVQATFDDRNPETVGYWKYPDTRTWDAERNVNEFIAEMPGWRKHGLLAVTLNLQGGSPTGYATDQPWHNSALNEDGGLDPRYLSRLERVIERADELGMVIILGVFYFGQDERFKDEAAVVAGLDATVDWLMRQNYRNVLLEINNECNVRYDHAILKPDRVHELIQRARERAARRQFRLRVGTSYGGNVVPRPNVVKASDFLLLHGNGVGDPARIREMVRQTRQVEGYRPMPILFNEDDHFDFDRPVNNFTAAVAEYASWGLFDYRMKLEGFDEGYQSVPVNWKTSSARKRGFFKLLSAITGES